MKTWRFLNTDRTAVYFAAAFFGMAAGVLFYKYQHFGYCDWDLAFFSQAMWNLCHGSQYSSIGDFNFFGDHAYLISFFNLPFFFIFPHPLTLVFLKLVAFVASALIFYRIIKEDLGPDCALALMGLYLFFPPNIFALLYDFNTESFAPVFLFLMFHYFRKQQYRPFIIASFFLILIKENMALITAAFGVYALFSRQHTDKIRWGVVPLILSLIIFYVLVAYFIPAFVSTGVYRFFGRYSYLKNGIGPLWDLLWSPVNIRWIGELFGPYLVPAFFSINILFLGAPVFIQHALSLHGPEHSIFYHYGPTMAVFIFLALARTLVLVRSKFNRYIFNGILTLMIILGLFNLVGHVENMSVRIDHHPDGLMEARWSLVQSIPPQAGVVATFDFLAELSRRPNLYAFHKIYDMENPLVVPADVQYALIDFQDPWLEKALLQHPEAVTGSVYRFLEDWKEERRAGSTVLYRRK